MGMKEGKERKHTKQRKKEINGKVRKFGKELELVCKS